MCQSQCCEVQQGHVPKSPRRGAERRRQRTSWRQLLLDCVLVFQHHPHHPHHHHGPRPPPTPTARRCPPRRNQQVRPHAREQVVAAAVEEGVSRLRAGAARRQRERGASPCAGLLLTPSSVQIDAHLCFSMFEWWETVILSTSCSPPPRPCPRWARGRGVYWGPVALTRSLLGLIVFPITALFWYSAFTYFPAHFEYISRRYAYYVFGDETVSTSALLRAWLVAAWEWVLVEGRRVVGEVGAKVEL